MMSTHKKTEVDRGISEITLSGFQVFDTKVRIPLRRLTFLYGPNSAGKSAVEDAIKIFGELYSRRQNNSEGPDWDRWPANRFERLRPHWRRVNEDDDGFSKSMHIEVLIRMAVYLERLLQDQIGKSSEPSEVENKLAGHDSCDYRVITDFHLSGNRWEGYTVDRDIELQVNESPVFALKEHEGRGLGVNLRNPIFEWVKFKSDFGALAHLHPDKVSLENGWVWVKGVCGGRHIDKDKTYFTWGRHKDTGKMSGKLAVDALVGAFTGGPLEGLGGTSPQLIEALDELAAGYDEFFRALLGNMVDTNFPIVSASRLIPPDQNLTALFEASDGSEMPLETLRSFGIECGAQAEYIRLIGSVLSSNRDTVGEGKNIWWNTISRNDNHEEPSAFGDRVNRMLTDHLFIDRGYRLNVDYRVVLTPEEFEYARYVGLKPDVDTPNKYSLLVRMFLEDSQGRRFSFAEVGSGLGYVLPVLNAVCSIHDISLIQQPELHLHPALQAALGDVFIESSSTGGQIVIETHSEHVLLRVLKRIRMTTAGKAPSEELALSSEDVSVIYFQPSPEGITTVKELRVSPDGDFMDRWPHGFFAERDQELFDE